MSYYGTKKLVSVRVDPSDYDRLRKILDEKNNDKPRWRHATFADIVDKAMREYIRENS